ncbi:MAG: choice-of-anchor tandem repeat GloVer-containing protein [Limisphaerales bacterium]
MLFFGGGMFELRLKTIFRKLCQWRLVVLICITGGNVSAQEVQTLYTLSGCTNGCEVSQFLLTSDGTIYASAYSGGISNRGTIFKLTPQKELSVLVHFTGTNGIFPKASLIQGQDERLYGTTHAGGYHAGAGRGTVFKVATNGADFTQLHSFSGSDGRRPAGKLFQDSNGDLFGTTEYGGVHDKGTVFKITTNGQFTSLLSFDGTNGATPTGGLLQANDGLLYGTTKYGGTSNRGTFFRMSREGVITTLLSFPVTKKSYSVVAPEGELVSAPNGTIHGIAYVDDSYQGAAFSVTTNGVITGLTQFAYQEYAVAPIAFGIDAKPYVMSTGYGFISPARIYKDFQEFVTLPWEYSGGLYGPISGLILGSDGALYGTRYGWFFRLPTAKLPKLSTKADGSLVVNGSVGGLYGLQFSTNIATTNWSTIETFKLTTPNHIIAETNIQSERFYRAIRP